ncbi:YkgJ family cysteine cluster protein [Halobacterium sp. R2-5]|uniref:YkgJ family cysteine cluster protein n=1 Tax=Halobacterium sp. R2-5 TaxID=2715751 RepID=UPI001422CEED|nr:YkgJ family cysteine cluster protein [Halobacterium sp. R2-5]NIB98172.1 YkgJ family cysteine cluster protein [Halobacterium sp. R2-5]
MEVDCENCAGCCVDWRPLADVPEHERRGPQRPLDDTYNLVPLTREDVRGFLDAGLADALTPRLWEASDGPSVEIDGHEVAAIAGKPAFFVGIRKLPKPVAPFDADASWLPTCAFLDPETLQCRVHDSDVYPEECAEYPGHNLALDVDTECERVERDVGGDRLLDGEPPDEQSSLLFGPQAVGEKVFAYPDPDDLADGTPGSGSDREHGGRVASTGVLERLAEGALTAEDRARFVAVTAASAPGTTAVEPNKREQAYETALDADSWVGAAAREWAERAGSDDPDPGLGGAVEEARGAPPTPGWGALDS